MNHTGIKFVSNNPAQSDTPEPSVAIPHALATASSMVLTPPDILATPETEILPTPISTQHPFLLSTPPTNTANSPTPSVHNAVLTRRNILNHISDNYRAISRTSRIMLMLNFMLSFALLIAIVVVLIVSRKQHCDKPLRVFLILHIVKCGLGIPLTLVRYLHPDGRHPQYSASTWVKWADRVKSLLDFLSAFIFILGNYLLFTSITCEVTSPPLFRMSLVMVVLGYFVVAIPVLLCGMVVFCLPCTLAVMRVFHIGPNNNTGAKPQEIKAITLLIYRHNNSNQPLDSNLCKAYSSPNLSRPKFKFLQNLKSVFNRKKYHVEEFVDRSIVENLPEFRVTDTEDALCTICLDEYADGELIRQLHCNHHFHQHPNEEGHC